MTLQYMPSKTTSRKRAQFALDHTKPRYYSRNIMTVLVEKKTFENGDMINHPLLIQKRTQKPKTTTALTKSTHKEVT